MPALRLLLGSLLAGAAAAQEPAVRLPRLLHLGPRPTALPVVTIGIDTVASTALPERTPAILLHVDERVRVGTLASVLAAARERGVETVHFAATLPDGTAGALTLALPAIADAPVSLVLRAHRERPGVPPESATALLSRLELAPRSALGLEVPADATTTQLLQFVAAIAAGGVSRVTITSTGAAEAAATSPDGNALALDLTGPLRIRVPASEQPRAKPAVQATPFGCLERADLVASAEVGGAGGRYGGRAVRPAAPGLAAARESSRVWCVRAQQPDGSLPDDQGNPDLGATGLVALAILGDGQHLAYGTDREPLRGAVGWLFAHQRADGSIAVDGNAAVAPHAIATWALAEAFGLSPNGKLLKPSLQRAIDWLLAQRQRDGGWNDGTPGAACDTLSTTQAIAALASARFFGIDVPPTSGELVAWYDTVAEPTGAHRAHAGGPKEGRDVAAATGAALFARFFCQQDPSRTPVMKAAADLLLAVADPQDPIACYWTTYALFQCGGRHWDEWRKRVDEKVVRGQVRDGDLRGSWPPAAGSSRVRTSALNVLTLEAYHRYARLVR